MRGKSRGAGRNINLFLYIIIVLFILLAAPLAPGTQRADAQVQEVADIVTGFNVTRDGYNFENFGSYAGSRGHCWGVSLTSVLFYEGMKERPGGP